MEHIQINAIRYDSNPFNTAEFTTMTVSKLIESLSKLNPDAPVIIKTGEEYSLVGQIKEEWWGIADKEGWKPLWELEGKPKPSESKDTIVKDVPDAEIPF